MKSHLSKAKRTDNGQWVEGYYQQRYDSFGTLEHLICYSRSANVWGNIKIDPDTLCDDTGLTDVNGNIIWGNDIVEKEFYTDPDTYVNSGKYVGLIRFKNCSWCIEYWSRNFDGCVTLRIPELLVYTYDVNYFKVIGNAFDNPELIKEHNLYCENNKRDVEAEHER